jgi:hypothetical protein
MHNTSTSSTLPIRFLVCGHAVCTALVNKNNNILAIAVFAKLLKVFPTLFFILLQNGYFIKFCLHVTF